MPAEIVLKKDQERRLLAGHLWIYSNEIDTGKSPLKEISPGDPVAITSHRGRWLGWGYANPHSLITARLVSRERGMRMGGELIQARLKMALSLRERLYSQPYYRLAFGEGDGLPGLVVDRYNNTFVVQITTAGMERCKDDIIEALTTVCGATTIVLRNDSPAREQEGLPSYVEVAAGEMPATLTVEEGGSSFVVSPGEGQKTGWFYDQASNRDRLLKYVPQKRVLDVFSYVAAWGIRAASAGAASVTCVDSSANALEQAMVNAERNGVADRLTTEKGDALAVLKAFKEAGEKFDVVILDPPAFVKRRKDLKAGSDGYQRLNRAGLDLLEPEGILVSASCSFHMDRDAFLRTITRAGGRADATLQLLEEGEQGPDHPVHPFIPETSYLKTFFLRRTSGY